MTEKQYRGRIAPSPTGYLHIGHAMTFWRAQERARAHDGKLVLRIEDLDRARCRPEFNDAIIEDLRWFGLEWDEGPDRGGSSEPYTQGDRRALYFAAWEKLRASGFIYPCGCSRKDVAGSALAPHDENEEPIYPGTCRPEPNGGAGAVRQPPDRNLDKERATPQLLSRQEAGINRPPLHLNWRFRVPDGEAMKFIDLRLGEQCATAGKHFGDFVVWRRDDVPAYQLAVVADDVAMQISEVVRGEDLLLSTFRQLLIYRALNLKPPQFYHAPLIFDEDGKRLAKRHAALSLRELRESGAKPEEIRQRYLTAD